MKIKIFILATTAMCLSLYSVVVNRAKYIWTYDPWQYTGVCLKDLECTPQYLKNQGYWAMIPKENTICSYVPLDTTLSKHKGSLAAEVYCPFETMSIDGTPRYYHGWKTVAICDGNGNVVRKTTDEKNDNGTPNYSPGQGCIF